MVDPQELGGAILASALAAAASARGIQSITASVRDDAEIERAIAALARQPHGSLIVPPSAWLSSRRTLLVKSAADHRLPVVQIQNSRSPWRTGSKPLAAV